VSLKVLTFLTTLSLVHHPQHLEIRGKEDICSTPVNQICGVVLLLAGLPPLMRYDGRIHTWYLAEQPIKIADDEMVVGNGKLEPPQKLQTVRGKKHNIGSKVSFHRPIYIVVCDSF